jgi:hypothetical protein
MATVTVEYRVAIGAMVHKWYWYWFKLGKVYLAVMSATQLLDGKDIAILITGLTALTGCML